MEGAGELNEPLENSTDVSHLRRKETDGSLQSNSRDIMESAAAPAFGSQESDWNQNLSSLRSPDLLVENMKGKDLITQCNSLSTGPESSYGSDMPVEELTLKNFRYGNLASTIGGSSSSGSGAQGKNCLWQNFYKLIGEPRDVGTRANNNNLSDPQSPPLQNILILNDSSSSERAVEQDNKNIGIESALPMKFTEGIRTKLLPSSGFAQFLVKNTLKGKGVAYRHPVARRKPPPIQQPQKSNSDEASLSKGVNDVTRISKLKPDKHSLYGGGGGNMPSSGAQEGISLRFWLKPGTQTINKAERLHIFKQILETVDLSHTSGLFMRHLRPSFFMISSSNKVKYVGAFEALDEHAEFFEDAIGQGTGHHSKRKRYMEHDHNGSLEHLLRRNLRYEDVALLGGGRPGLSEASGDVFGRDRSEGYSFNTGIREPVLRKGYLQQDASISLDALPMPEILQLEERWYACPEELVGAEACSHASNIYSLGVLFFELFCFFESWEVHASSMLDLRHRILPSSFLSETPKEAGFCLWLLHPEPSSRPKSRDVLLSDLISESENIPVVDQSLTSYGEEDSEAELLLHFLLCVKEQKEKKAEKLVKDIRCLRSDIEEADRRHSSRIQALSPYRDSSSRYNESSENIFCKVPSHLGVVPNLSSSAMNEERLMKNIKQLETAYFSMRSKIELPDSNTGERSDKDVLQSRDKQLAVQNNDEEFSGRDTDRLGVFFEGLSKYARYSKFEVRGTLRNGDILNSANVICSLSFDRDEEYFAAAGVSRKIKIFEYASLLNDMVDIHYPAVELSSRSKLSCVCWNGYIKNYLASTDYDGIVQLWDATTGQGFSQYVEHQKRAWSVDFSRVDPTKLASGSDDYCVKLWNINEKNSTSTIRNVANVCCVQFSADSTNMLAFGSADYKVYCYDLRNVRVPWCTLVGHGKAVSYVKFVDSETLISASTDNTLKIWDLNKTNPSGFSPGACSLTLRGHTNEKNFVGLSVSDGYIACGSETNEVFTYYKSLPMPIASHKFGSTDPISGQEIGDDNGQFVSSVCWKGKSGMVVAANSAGGIKLLQMV